MNQPIDWSRPGLLEQARRLHAKHGPTKAAEELSKRLGRKVTEGAVRGALRRTKEPSTMPIKVSPSPASAFSREGGGVGRGSVSASLKRPRIEERDDDLLIVRAENEELLRELTRLRKRELTTERVRREILCLAATPTRAPDWTTEIPRNPDLPGTPTLFTSDQHYAEVVRPEEIGGVNEYNVDIAKRRWRRMVEKTIELCHGHMVRPEYPGIVVAAGGDGLSGDIHDELSATNEQEIMPAVLGLADLYVWTIREFKRHFKRVFFAGVIGNHARNSHKPRHKGACHTNFDWLSYQVASRAFEGDKDVQFLIPGGPDARFSIYGHRYLLTHGNQFTGGDGIIGALGPVTRGDVKKRGRNSQIRQDYDTLLVGHWHQLHMGERVIMNGSMVGYNEYASNGNFPFELPRQALWMTHPRYGITFSFPVRLEDAPLNAGKEEWVRWAA